MTLLQAISAAEYHRDPCPVPSLSASIAHIITSESSKHAWLVHPKFGAKSREQTASMSTGQIRHAMILGSGAEFAVIKADNFKTNKAKEERETAIALGKLPMLEHQHDEHREASFRTMTNLKALGVRFSGEIESMAVWSESAANGNTVTCRALMDHYAGDTIDDLKFVEDASPRSIRSKMETYGYAIQAVAYERAIAQLDPSLEGRIQMRFLFCEVNEPYCVVPAFLGGTMHELGSMRWQRAVATWEECCRTNVFPGYEPMRVEASAFALEQEMLYGP